MIARFLPDSAELHPVSKVFSSLRATCQAIHTEFACRNHLQDIARIVDANRSQPPKVVRTFAQIPYRDPAPLSRLMALDDDALRSALADWPAIDALLNQYIPPTMAIAGDIDFARAARLSGMVSRRLFTMPSLHRKTGAADAGQGDAGQSFRGQRIRGDKTQVQL